MLDQLLQNKPLCCSACAWFLAQLIKALLYWAIEKKFDGRRIWGSGGMPSSHSAFVLAMTVALGLSFLWDQVWLRVVGGFGLMCSVITFHAVFNVFVSQTGPVFWIGNAIPLAMVLAYLLFFRWKAKLS